MARKGDQARSTVTNTILSAFPGSFVADKKIYVAAEEGGEAIQFAISLTMPKNPVANPGGGAPTPVTGGSHDWSGGMAVPAATPIEIPKEEDEKVLALMERLGIEP